MNVSITISHVNGNNIAMYIDELTAKSAEGRISLYLLQPRMNTPKRKGEKISLYIVYL